MSAVTAGVYRGIDYFITHETKYTYEFSKKGVTVWVIESSGELSEMFIRDFIDLHLDGSL